MNYFTNLLTNWQIKYVIDNLINWMIGWLNYIPKVISCKVNILHKADYNERSHVTNWTIIKLSTLSEGFQQL